MSISAYTGLPGHGKSYGVVANVILPALRQKRTVFTNIPLNDDLCISEFGLSVVPFDIQDLIKNPNWFKDVFIAGSIIVIDEVWRLWPSGLKMTAAREGDKEFLAEHRHLVGENGLSTEIILVTQDLSQVASFARALVENTFRVTKLISLGLNSRFRVDVYFGPVTGAKPNVKNREREIFGKFSKDVYKFYKSHTKSETGMAGDETRIDRRYNILGGMSIKLGLIFCFFIVLFIVFKLNDVKKGMKVDDESLAKMHGNTVSTSSSVVAVGSSQVSTIALQANVQAVAPVIDKPKFLSAARRLFVSFTISKNATNTDFYVVEFSDYSVTLDNDQLSNLGYKLEKVSDCLVKVSGYDYSGFFMCAKQKEPPQTFGAQIAQTTDQVLPPAP